MGQSLRGRREAGRSSLEDFPFEVVSLVIPTNKGLVASLEWANGNVTQVPGGDYVPRCEAKTNFGNENTRGPFKTLRIGKWRRVGCVGVSRAKLPMPESTQPPTPTLRAQNALEASSVKTSKIPTAYGSLLPCQSACLVSNELSFYERCRENC